MRVTDPEDLPKGLVSYGEGGLLATRAIRRGVEVEFTDSKMLVLRYAGRTHRFRRGWSTLNTRLACRCVQQKEIAARLLTTRDVPTPETVVFRSRDVDKAWWWSRSQLPVVLKPTSADSGKLVHVGVKRRRDFIRAFARVADEYGEVLVQEQLPGIEHRVAMVGREVVAATRRVPMHVVGDGTNTIADLIQEKNAERRRRRNPIHKKLTIDDAVLSTLASQRLRLNDTPPDGQTVWLRRTSNISAGGDAIDATDDISEAIRSLVVRAAQAIPGLRLAGWDVVIHDDAAWILEANHAPMFSMHHWPWGGQVRDVYSRVLEAMFPELRVETRA